MSTAAPPVDLRPDHLGIVRDILRRHIPDRKVLAFGSRATWTAKEYSDLDLVILGDEPLPLGVTAALADDFSESDLPFKVDLVDWARLDESFRNIVRHDQVAVQNPVRRSECLTMVNEWQRGNLGDYAVLVRNTVSPSVVGDVPYIGLEHVAQNTLSLLGIGKSQDVTSAKLRFRKDDILFGKLRPYFRKVVRPSFDGICSTDFWVIRSKKEGVDQGFLFYLFASQSVIQLAISSSEGTRMPRANWDYLSQCEVIMPPLSEQRAISHILSALDDKIDLNRRMNKPLEAMVRAIFKDWFVDFGPTRAKMEGLAPYLPSEIWDLFPDSFDDQGKPRGWKVGMLDEIADAPRRSINPVSFAKDTPYIGLEHMPRRSIALTEWEGAGKIVSNKSIFKKGEFLFGKLRPYFHKIGMAPLDGICSADIVVVAPREPHWAAFILACLSSDAFVGYTDQTSNGTKMPRTSWKTMRQYELCLPPNQIVDAFQDLMQSLLNRIDANTHENRTLAELRDTLLPKLLGGRIKLPEIETVVEEVVNWP